MDIHDMKFDQRSIPFPLSSQVTRSSYGLAEAAGTPRWVLGYEECYPDYAVDRLSGFPFWIVEIVLHGEGEGTFAEGPFAISRGSFWKYGPNVPISFRASAGTPMKKVFIGLLDSPSLSPLFDRIEPGIHNRATSIGLVEGLFRELRMIDSGGSGLSDSSEEALVGAIIALLYRARTAPERNSAREVLIRRALRALEMNFARLQSVQDWAGLLGVSPSHFSRAMKASTGRTPYYALLDHKVNRAFHLLSAGAGSVREVARMVGFEDPFHFSRVFKRRLGFPPSHVSKFS